LGELAENGEHLDAIYVSHIDQDHISGVLQLLEDMLEWKVYDYHQAEGNGEVQEPEFPRLPMAHGIWHNAFRDLIAENQGEIEELLAAAAPALYGTGVGLLVHAAHEMENIEQSIPEALRVSALVRPNLLDIPLNSPPGRSDPGQLMLMEEPNQPFSVGSLQFQLIGPSQEQLERLREGWNEWLLENRDRTGEIRAEIQRRVAEFASGTLEESPFDLHRWNGVPSHDEVTVPNTASMMFLVEEDGTTVLLTGDSHQDMILEGLAEVGALVGDGHIHVDVLKVPHHGSEHNVDENFCQRVSADHYIFCGNGSHGNPEPETIQMYYDSRCGPAEVRSLSPEADDRDFQFWFSTASDFVSNSHGNRANLQQTEDLLSRLLEESGGRMHVHYNKGDSISLDL